MLAALDTTHSVPLPVLTAHGMHAVGGYAPTRMDLHPTWKTILPAYVHQLTAAGFGEWEVLETVTSQARQGGYAGGHLHGEIAALFADALGKPKDRLVGWAIDEDDPIDAVRDYARGFKDGAALHGREAYCYCGAEVGEQLVAEGLIVTYWKTGSRSFDHGVAPVHADIIQKTSAAIPGTDDDVIINPQSRIIWWGEQPTPPAPVWHGVAFPGPVELNNPIGRVNAIWKFMLIVAGYGHFNHATEADLIIFGTASVAELTRLQHDHDVILYLGGETDLTKYWGTYHDGVGTFTGHGGTETWKFLNWMIANLKAH